MTRKQKQVLFALATTTAFLLVLLWKRQPSTSVPALHFDTNRPVEAIETAGHEAFTNRESNQSRRPPPTPQELAARVEQMKGDFEREIGLWQSSLIYFGKVIDEKGVPIPNVQISYGANSLNEAREEVYNTGIVTTDDRGIFKIEGVRGIGLRLQLSHPHCYPYPDNSTGFDKRSVPRSGYFSDSEEKAQIFRMHRKGNPVALIKRGGGLHAPTDGTVVGFPFRGATRDAIIGRGQIEGWKGSPDPRSGGHYDWKVKITVPNGGIASSTNYFDFIAPETGYHESFEITVSKHDPNWQTRVEKRLFFKLSNYFVLANVSIDIYHDLYFSMDYFVNPDGSRNLEPAQPTAPKSELPPGVTERIPEFK